MNWIKENGGLIGLIAVASVAVGVFAELRIRQHLDNMNVPTDDRIGAIEGKVDAQKEVHDRDTEEWKRRVERIVDILLEE